jgi:CHAT domain-containing protein/tetratricopeptide (TPR) repeat protein
MANDVLTQIKALLRRAEELEMQGAYERALPLTEQATDLARSYHGVDPLLLGASVERQAGLARALGNYARADSLFQEVLEIQRAQLGEQHPQIARTLNNLAELYREMGAYPRAESLYLTALEIETATGHGQSLGAATIEGNLALLYAAIGSNNEAASLLEKSLQQSISILGEDHSEIATAKDNLGVIYARLGKYDRAKELHLQALAIYRATLGEEHPDAAICLLNLAYLYQDVGDVREAVRLYRRAVALFGRIFGRDSVRYATAVHNLGFAYLDLGDYAAAEPLLRRALVIRRMALGGQHPDVGVSLSLVAEACAATGREEEALQLLDERIAIDEHSLGETFFGMSIRHRLEHLASLRNRLEIYLSVVLQARPKLPLAAQRGLAFVLRRKGLSVDAMALRRDLIIASGQPAVLATLQKLTDLRRQVYHDMIAGPRRESRIAYKDRLNEGLTAAERLEAELARQLPETRLDQQLQRVRLDEIAAVLPPHSHLVEFIRVSVFDFSIAGPESGSRWKADRYLAFVLPAGEPNRVQLIDLGEAEPIDKLVVACLTSITGEAESTYRLFQGPEPATSDQKLAGQSAATYGGKRDLIEENDITGIEDVYLSVQLREKVWDPLLPGLNGGTRLVLAPDGELNRLPFEILPLANGQRVIDDYHVSYVNTGRDVLQWGLQPHRQPSPPLVLADPDFDLGTMAEDERIDVPRLVHRLAGTRREGERISQSLGVQPLLGAQALSSTLKSCMSPLILHIASHGYFVPDYYPLSTIDLFPEHIYLEDIRDLPDGRLHWLWGRPAPSPLLRSGLILAGYNTWLRGGNPPAEAEEGVVTAADVLNMDLLSTQLVVLSACETGSGAVAEGEGVFGLGRAFVLAGASTLVMSLWKIPDQQTQELMVEFYKRLLRGEGRAEALRAAQLALQVRYPHPRYWGAFICQGDPKPLPVSRPQPQP